MLLIDAIAQVESGGQNIPGDHGHALSIFQIHEAVWQDVHRRFGNPRQGHYIDIGAQFTDIAGDDQTSRLRARNTATGQIVLIEEYLLNHNVSVTAENIYACWNLGCHGYKKRKFDLKACPQITILNARAVAQLSDQHPHSL